MFEDLGSRDDQVLGFQTAGKALRAQLLQNSHFASLPAWLRKKLMKGDTASILTEDQLLHRMGAVDQNTGVVIRLLSSHADLSPLAYYRTGDSNRGRGEENEVDKGYMALALDFANDVLLRATGDMKDLFEDPLALNSPEPVNAKPVDPVASAPLYWGGIDRQRRPRSADALFWVLSRRRPAPELDRIGPTGFFQVSELWLYQGQQVEQTGS
jgi:hypothetical protein